MNEENKPHWNTGRRNAAKEGSGTSWIQMRIDTEKKAGYVKRAQDEGMKLTEWIFKTLDAAK